MTTQEAVKFVLFSSFSCFSIVLIQFLHAKSSLDISCQYRKVGDYSQTIKKETSSLTKTWRGLKKIVKMSSDDEDMDYRPDTLDEMAIPANSANTQIPAASREKYNKVYDDFQRWRDTKGTPPVSENVLMAFFTELQAKHKPSTLWVMYSMLKATLRTNDEIDITPWAHLNDYLKRNNVGYKPVKAKIFTEEEIERFMNEAPDEHWLDVKVWLLTVHGKKIDCNNDVLFAGCLYIWSQWRV